MKTIYAFLLGMYEFRLTFTTCINHPDLMRTYDRGREWAHRLTFRFFEQPKPTKHIHLLRLLKK